VKKAVGEHRFSLANGFRHSKLKNRIAMMIKPQSSGWMRLAYGAILPVLAVLMFACNPAREQQDEIDPDDLRIETKADDMKPIKYAESLQELVDKLATQNIDATDLKYLRDIADRYEKRARANAGEDELRELSVKFLSKLDEITDKLRESSDKPTTLSDGSVPFQLVEVKPGFNGGDANKFSEWVNAHLKYPEASKAAGEQGRVVLQFQVGSDGVVRDVKVLRGVSEALDAEAVRVISASPDWEPGMQDGKAVAVTYTFPIVFQLK
jgi:TonB family protein